MNKSFIFILVQLAAFWPVWRWYAARVINSTDERWSLLALGTVIFFFARKKPAANYAPLPLILATALTLLYALTFPFFPPLLRASVAMAAVGCTVSALRFGIFVHPGIVGLLLLPLPVIPSLQFYGVYPLRLFCARVAASLLQLGGLAVIQEGTCLNWCGHLIWIDAPCSGVRMLWSGMYLACALICLFEVRPLKALLALSASFVAIIIGNIMRAIALFYLEAGIVVLPAWAHEGIGVVTFVFVGLGILLTVNWIRGEKVCGL